MFFISIYIFNLLNWIFVNSLLIKYVLHKYASSRVHWIFWKKSVSKVSSDIINLRPEAGSYLQILVIVPTLRNGILDIKCLSFNFHELIFFLLYKISHFQLQSSKLVWFPWFQLCCAHESLMRMSIGLSQILVRVIVRFSSSEDIFHMFWITISFPIRC